MADKQTDDTPANAMDYPEHERTYDAFLWLTKWTVAFCIGLLIAMAFGFYAGGGLFGGTLLMILLMIVCYFFI